MSAFEQFDDQLRSLDRMGRRRALVPRAMSGLCFEEQGQTLINFGSNDYLGFRNRIQNGDWQVGTGSSSLVCGWTDRHQHLAESIAAMEGTEAAVIFPSGFAACSGTVATLPGKDDLILSDELNHASLIDGCRLSKAKRIVYPHRCVDEVAQVLSTARKSYDRVWIVTDGVFSMDGHVAPLSQLCDLADQYEADLLVDEAHGTGVLGRHGSGVCEAMGVKERVAIRMGTLSKAIGSQGGFVVGPHVVIDYLVNCCRSLIYSTSLSLAAVEAAIKSIRLIRSEPESRQRVQEMSVRVRQALSSDLVEIEKEVPIIPLVVGDERETLKLARSLWELGLYVPAIRPPTVPEGSSRLRISLSADHTNEMISQLIEMVRLQR